MLLELILILVQLEQGLVSEPGAVGPLQIHECVVEDVNRHLGYEAFDPRDREDPEQSCWIAYEYLSIYGKGRTDTELVRIWNGGPDGHLETCTLRYLERYLEWRRCNETR
jgi:hypothetical protein